MKYRSFPPLSTPVSALGFGAMRFPSLPDDPQQVDEKRSVRMLRRAVDSGVNYIDTAYPYHEELSEGIVGLALQNGYRERVYLADKLPIWKVKERSDVSAFLDTQLHRLQTGYIDLYLIHALDAARWEKTKRLEILEELEEEREKGRIGHIGFSFHDEFSVFRKIIEEYDGWEFCQIQYNFMDTEFQAGRRGLRLAAERGLGVVVMEPLKGGQLAGTPPAPVERTWSAAPVRIDPVSAALRWVWDQPEPGTVLSGMSSDAQLEENLASAEWGFPGNMSAAERQTVEKVREAYESLSLIGCTSCGYCLPCPEGVHIPRILQLYNDLYKYGDAKTPRGVYNRVLSAAERADNCTACGNCEAVCPQQLPIISSLEQAHKELAENVT